MMKKLMGLFNIFRHQYENVSAIMEICEKKLLNYPYESVLYKLNLLLLWLILILIIYIFLSYPLPPPSLFLSHLHLVHETGKRLDGMLLARSDVRSKHVFGGAIGRW